MDKEKVEVLRQAIAEVIPRIELRRWPWKIEIHTPIAGQILFINEHVRDRDTGKQITLGGMSYGLPAEGEDLVAWIYKQLQRHVLHELAEAFHVDGVRVFDPHG